mgnify:CR=1 FL=1
MPQVDRLANVVREAIEEESAERLTDLDNTLKGKEVTSSMGPGFNVPVRSIKPFVDTDAARSHSLF